MTPPLHQRSSLIRQITDDPPPLPQRSSLIRRISDDHPLPQRSSVIRRISGDAGTKHHSHAANSSITQLKFFFGACDFLLFMGQVTVRPPGGGGVHRIPSLSQLSVQIHLI